MLQVLKDYGSSIDGESLRMMPYADAAIKEMLHHCGIAAVSPKIALKTFEVGGYTIPKVGCASKHIWRFMDMDRYRGARYKHGKGLIVAPNTSLVDNWVPLARYSEQHCNVSVV